MMLIIKESSKQEEKRELPLTQNHKFTHIPYFVFNSLKEWETEAFLTQSLLHSAPRSSSLTALMQLTSGHPYGCLSSPLRLCFMLSFFRLLFRCCLLLGGSGNR